MYQFRLVDEQVVFRLYRDLPVCWGDGQSSAVSSCIRAKTEAVLKVAKVLDIIFSRHSIGKAKEGNHHRRISVLVIEIVLCGCGVESLGGRNYG